MTLTYFLKLCNRYAPDLPAEDRWKKIKYINNSGMDKSPISNIQKLLKNNCITFENIPDIGAGFFIFERGNTLSEFYGQNDNVVTFIPIESVMTASFITDNIYNEKEEMLNEEDISAKLGFAIIGRMRLGNS
jgi:hypothetical protein